MKKGFSLIELLAAVLIIGILSSIALPYYRKAIEHARAAEPIAVWDYVKKMAQTELSAGTLKGGEYGTEDHALCAPWFKAMGLRQIDKMNFRSDHFLYHIRDCLYSQVTVEISRSDQATTFPPNADSLYELSAGVYKTGLRIRTDNLHCLGSSSLHDCKWFNNN